MLGPVRGIVGVALILGVGLGPGEVQAQAPASKKAKAKAGLTKAGDAGPKFSKEIAPILVANCTECHNAERRRGKFDLTSFQKLMTGSESGKVILPGKPAESPLVRHLKGLDDPKMPPGNRTLASEAIDKVEAWVKAGALLDAGVDPRAELKTIAPSAADLRRAELTRLAPEERDRRLEEVSRERWKKADPKTTPDVTSSAHFLLFGTLSPGRAKATLGALEAQYLTLNRLLSRSPTTPALDWPEKISVYVFNETSSYVEFARAIENREVEDEAHANLSIETPYLVAIDPLAGRDEEPARKRPGKSKRVAESGGPERTLAGLLAEQLGAAATARAGKAPRWLSLGLGAYLGAQVEPRSLYYHRLRVEAARSAKDGWATRAQEALGDATATEKIRALGFSLIEWLATTDRERFATFARGMLEGREKLDGGIKALWGVDRKRFLNEWGTWVAARYGGA